MPRECRPLKDAEGAVAGFACGPGARTLDPGRAVSDAVTRLREAMLAARKLPDGQGSG